MMQIVEIRHETMKGKRKRIVLKEPMNISEDMLDNFRKFYSQTYKVFHVFFTINF